MQRDSIKLKVTISFSAGNYFKSKSKLKVHLQINTEICRRNYRTQVYEIRELYEETNQVLNYSNLQYIILITDLKKKNWEKNIHKETRYSHHLKQTRKKILY